MSKPKFNPSQPFTVADKPKFNPTQPFDEVSSTAPSVSELESFLRGAVSGGSFGFADEITGGLESLITDKSYEQARNESRKAYKDAQDANPMSYGAGEIGGAIGTALIPGVGALNAGKAATFAGRMGAAALQGGLSGVGLSEADNAQELIKDAAIGAGTGAALQGVGEKVLAPALKNAGNYISNKLSIAAGDSLIDKGLQKAGKLLADIPEADTARYLENPEAVNNSLTIGELGDDLLRSTDSSESLLSQMYKKASDLSGESWKTLDPNKSVPKIDIKRAIADAQDELLTDGVLLGDNQSKAFQKLAGLTSQLDALPENIPQTTMKRIIQALDENINWNDPNSKVTNDSLRKIRGFVDGVLKINNSDYANAMAKTEDVSKAIETVKSAFQNRQNPESFDKFIKGVKNLNNKSEYSNVSQALDKIKQHTGFDLREQILNAQAKSAFLKDTTNGSRKTLAGAMTGSAAGSMLGPLGASVGGAVGSTIGAGADKYAGIVFKNILDGKINSQAALEQLGPRLGKYSAVLRDAASRGNKSLAATHFLLSQRDPEYRQKIKELESE